MALLVITVSNARTGAIVNVTGFSFKLTVDKHKQNPTASPSTTKVFDVTGVVTNGAAGEVTLLVQARTTPQQENFTTTFS